MPRMVPRRETEWLDCAIVSGWPIAAETTSARYHSRNTPRSSANWRGVNSQAPGTASSRTSMAAEPMALLCSHRARTAAGNVIAVLAVSAVSFNTGNPLAGLRVGDVAEPTARPGWVAVRVRAAALNRHDV